MNTIFSKLKNDGILIALFFFFIFSHGVNAQTDWEQLFFDDFEDGVADGWQFELYMANSKWEVVNNNGNYVLYGESHNWARPEVQKNWTNYFLKCRIKILFGGLHINFRVSDRGRYYIPFNSDEIELKKQDYSTGEFYNLAINSENYPIENWYEIKILGINNNLKIYVNDVLKIDYNDPIPIKAGSIAFEANPDAKVFIDYVEVMGEPLPKPPPGYVWERMGGPFGGTGYDIRIHPNDKKIMFVTDNPSGVNKSIDGGETWSQKNEGIPVDPERFGNGAPIFSLTIDPSNPDIVWCGAQDHKGIYKSIDGGESWEKKINGVVEDDEISFRGFAIHPHNSNIVLAAAEIQTDDLGYYYNKVKGKIYKTTNGGENWYSVWEGNNLARVLIYNYDNPDILYCSTGIFDREAINTDVNEGIIGGEGVLKSTDGGENWFNINNGINNTYIGFLEMHPSNPEILYAAAGCPTLQEKLDLIGILYKTVDGGQNWKTIFEKDSYFSVVTISKSNPNIVYAGHDVSFFRSEDAGNTWQEFNNGYMLGGFGPPGMTCGIPISAVVDPYDAYTVFVNGYQGGNFKSIDGGENWLYASKGYTGLQLTDVYVNKNKASHVFTIGRTGPFKSYDGAVNWEGIGYDWAGGPRDWHKIIMISDNPEVLLLSKATEGLILKSENGGFSWRVVYNHPEVYNYPDRLHGFKALAAAPSNSQIVYAGMRKTTGGGHIDPDPSIGSSYGIYKSIDGGETWDEKNNGLEATMKSINVIVVHPNSPDTVYAGTLIDGIYKSTNGGDSWIRHSNGLGSTDIRSMAIDPMNPHILYAGSGEGKGIYKSNNGGDLWEECNSGIQIECPSYLLPVGNTNIGFDLTPPKKNRSFINNYTSIPWTKIFDIVIDPKNPNDIYAADFNTGIYLSKDGGATWWPINEGLSIRSVTALSISSDGEILYCATSGAGVHRLVLGENKAPIIISTIPNNSDTVSISIGDSLWFETSTFDFDNDTLTYEWFFDNQIIPDENKPQFLLKTDNQSPGQHHIKTKISDDDTTISVKWLVQIISPTFVFNSSENLPKSFSLKQNYPNPFNPITTISYQLPKASYVELKIFNMSGQEIKTLIAKQKQAGFHSIEWDGTNNNNTKIASGVYIYRVEFKNNQNSFIQARKMILLK